MRRQGAGREEQRKLPVRSAEAILGNDRQKQKQKTWPSIKTLLPKHTECRSQQTHWQRIAALALRSATMTVSIRFPHMICT